MTNKMFCYLISAFFSRFSLITSFNNRLSITVPCHNFAYVVSPIWNTHFTFQRIPTILPNLGTGITVSETSSLVSPSSLGQSSFLYSASVCKPLFVLQHNIITNYLVLCEKSLTIFSFAVSFNFQFPTQINDFLKRACFFQPYNFQCPGQSLA